MGPVITINNVVQRPAPAPKINKSTVVKICEEKYSLYQEELKDTVTRPSVLVIFGKKRSRQELLIKFDTFQEDAIRHHVSCILSTERTSNKKFNQEVSCFSRLLKVLWSYCMYRLICSMLTATLYV